MFLEERLRESDEPSGVSAADNGCMWVGCLYQRKSGGFDLFFDHASRYAHSSSPIGRSRTGSVLVEGAFAKLKTCASWTVKSASAASGFVLTGIP
jgi:hypothetical protein